MSLDVERPVGACAARAAVRDTRRTAEATERGSIVLFQYK
jgi:hypothetical protein